MNLSEHKRNNDILTIVRNLISKEKALLSLQLKDFHKNKNFSEDEYINGCIDTYNDIFEKISIIKTPIHKLR